MISASVLPRDAHAGALKSSTNKDYHPILTPDCNPALTQSMLSLH